MGVHEKRRERARDRLGLVYLLHIYIYSKRIVEVKMSGIKSSIC